MGTLKNRAWWFLLLQVLVSFLVIWRLRIGEDFGFFRLLPLILSAYIAQWFLNERWRPRLFALVSVFGLLAILGWQAALLVVSVGLAFIGACHLPGPRSLRFIALALLALGLIKTRIDTVEGDGTWGLAIPVLGSMLMFRLFLYAIEIQRGTERPTVWQSMGYIFMVPNVSFLLFPVVSPSTFWRGQSTSGQSLEEFATTTQSGLRWIARGIAHILVYRALYHFVAPRPEEVTDLRTLALFMVSSYALYVRISGQFHMIAGTLGVLGVKLPPTHDWYLLSLGLTDLWRRINLYWYDFMLKTFYLPTYFALRKGGERRAAIVSVIAVFAGSWFLHSYQWFWLRGTFPITEIDATFWSLFCAFVVLGQAIERKSQSENRVIRTAAQLSASKGAKSLFTFAVMCILWSFLSSASITDWLNTIEVAAQASPRDLLWLAPVLILGWLALSVLHHFESRLRGDEGTVRSGLWVVALVVPLGMITTTYVQERLPQSSERIVAGLVNNRLNERDEEMMVRGYYENVVALDRYVGQLWRKQLQAPPDWGRPRLTVWTPGDFRWRLPKNHKRNFKRARLSTNAFGMRDKTYTKVPAKQTWRAALLGASIEMGAGVDDGENFESLVERRLNQEYPKGEHLKRFEILNFSVPGTDLLRRVHLLETEVVGFHPDVAIFASAGPKDGQKTIEQLVRTVTRQVDVPYEPIRAIIAKSGASPELSQAENARRLEPFGPEIVRWCYARFVQVARTHKITPVWMFVPVSSAKWTDEEVRTHRAWAEQAKMVTLTLEDAYQGRDEKNLILAPWDFHPNAVGHALLAAALWEELKDKSDVLGLPAANPG